MERARSLNLIAAKCCFTKGCMCLLYTYVYAPSYIQCTYHALMYSIRMFSYTKTTSTAQAYLFAKVIPSVYDDELFTFIYIRGGI